MIQKILSRLRYEKRASSAYSDAVISALLSEATGESKTLATATGALEAVAGLVQRAFASCEVSGAPDYAEQALTPECLGMIGRSLIRNGEIVFEVRVMDGRLRLMPASAYDIQGDSEKSTWSYRLDFMGPDSQTTRDNIMEKSVIHCRYAVDPDQPWKGLSAISVAKLAGRLSAQTIAALGDEASGPRGSFMPTPKPGDDPTMTGLRNDVTKSRGRMMFVESMSSAWKSGEAPPADWMQKRFGPSPPDSLVKLLPIASREVFAAYGLNEALFSSQGETAQRESWRIALHGVVSPIGRLVQEELREKLDAPGLTLNWSALSASDLQGRARSFQSMVGGGMPLERAAALSGLMLPEDD